MEKKSSHQKKTVAPIRSHPTKTSVKSPVRQEDDLQGAIGNRQMGLLIQEHSQSHPSSVFPTNPGAMPMLGGSMPIGPGRIQRQPEFRGLSQELAAENATLALPATGALVQRKLTLGEPGDMYEQEADRVARQVVDEIHSTPFREQNALSEEERNPAGGNAGRVQRQITVRSAGDAGGELSSEWEGELQRAKSGGQRLSPVVKEPMERAFGADFGGVRVHTGAQADRLARSIQAKAFTTGQDVYFRQGAYEPGSRGGMEIIAHEMTHVVQQQKSKANPKVNRWKEEKEDADKKTQEWRSLHTKHDMVADNLINKYLNYGKEQNYLYQKAQFSIKLIRVKKTINYKNQNNPTVMIGITKSITKDKKTRDDRTKAKMAKNQEIIEKAIKVQEIVKNGFKGIIHNHTELLNKSGGYMNELLQVHRLSQRPDYIAFLGASNNTDPDIITVNVKENTKYAEEVKTTSGEANSIKNMLSNAAQQLDKRLGYPSKKARVIATNSQIHKELKLPVDFDSNHTPTINQSKAKIFGRELLQMSLSMVKVDDKIKEKSVEFMINMPNLQNNELEVHARLTKEYQEKKKIISTISYKIMHISQNGDTTISDEMTASYNSNTSQYNTTDPQSPSLQKTLSRSRNPSPYRK